MRLKVLASSLIIAGVVWSGSPAHVQAANQPTVVSRPNTSRPYRIYKISNVTAFFDNGECGYVYDGMPRVGAIQSFWRPDILGGVFTWGFTQDDVVYSFVPAPCDVGL